jgi:N-acetylmuramic acid 6-phosphate etherase
MVEFEEKLYRRNGLVTYMADECLLDILTDTTERTPTFRLPPFRKCDDAISPPSWSFVKNPTLSTSETWLHAMRRLLRGLDWNEAIYRELNASETIQKHHPDLSNSEIMKYRIGNEDDPSRYTVPDSAAVMMLAGEEFSHLQPDDSFNKGFMRLAKKFHRKAAFYIGTGKVVSEGLEAIFHVPYQIPPSPFELWGRLAVKLAMNTVSTATMARMGRLDGNLMVYVETSNKKLIDRGVRLIAEVVGVSYEKACYELFETMETIESTRKPGDPIVSPVALTIDRLRKSK